MKALKVQLHQHSAVYRNPTTTEVVETYPLPPPSTVLGLVHSMLRILNQKPGSLNLSIQGDYKAVYRDYQWYKQYSKDYRTWSNRPKPVVVHTLFDIDILLHFYIPDVDLLNQVKSCFDKLPYYPYLGRAEDIIKIDILNPPRLVDILNRQIDSEFTKRGAYLRSEEASKLRLRGVLYSLPTWLREYQKVLIDKEEKILRNFDWEALQYIEADSYIELDEPITVHKDEEGDHVWWCMPSPMEKH